MDDIFVRYYDLPCSVRSYVALSPDGAYTIIINSRIGNDMQLLAYQHELAHIKHGDYERKCSVDKIEICAHALNKGGLSYEML